MELENLKETWKESVPGNSSPADIRRMLGQQSKLPLYKLKKRFRKALVIIPVAVTYVIWVFSKRYNLLSDILFWAYLMICFSVLIYAYKNYRKIGRLQKMDEPVYDHLMNEINAIEKSIRIHHRSILLLLFLFFILIEVLLYFQVEPLLRKWSGVFWYYRILYYAGFFLLRETISRLVFQYRFKKHIDTLKEIARQMR